MKRIFQRHCHSFFIPRDHSAVEDNPDTGLDIAQVSVFSSWEVMSQTVVWTQSLGLLCVTVGKILELQNQN